MADAAVRLAENVWRIPTQRWDLINSFALVDEDGSVTRIVLTHAHEDHAGGAAAASQLTGSAVTVHEGDAVYIRSGTTPALDQSVRLGRLLTRLRTPTIAAAEIAEVLTDDQLLPVAGGLRVVHTPGHTPGHVSLLHEPSRLLITGDSIFNVLGLRWPVKAFCTDFRMSQRTAHVLGELDYDLAAFTHGTEIRERARERVRAFVRAAKDAA